MKRTRFFEWCLSLSLLIVVGGCGGYAQTEHSGVQVYGTVDAGVSHQGR